MWVETNLKTTDVLRLHEAIDEESGAGPGSLTRTE